MFRLWGKIWKDNHLIKDTVICNDENDTRTHKVFGALEKICYEMDLGNPIHCWTRPSVNSRTRPHNFIRIILLSRLILITWKSRL